MPKMRTNKFSQGISKNIGCDYPKPLCVLFPDTKGIQWVDTDATHALILSAGVSLLHSQQVLLPSTTTGMYDQHPEGTTHR